MSASKSPPSCMMYLSQSLSFSLSLSLPLPDKGDKSNSIVKELAMPCGRAPSPTQTQGGPLWTIFPPCTVPTVAPQPHFHISPPILILLRNRIFMILSKKMVLVFTDLPTIFSSVKQPQTHDPLSVVPLPSDVPPDGYKYNNTNGFSLFIFIFLFFFWLIMK